MTNLIRRELLVEEKDAILSEGLESFLEPGSIKRTDSKEMVRDYGTYNGCHIEAYYSMTNDSRARIVITGKESDTFKVANEIRNLDIYQKNPESILFKREISKPDHQ